MWSSNEKDWIQLLFWKKQQINELFNHFQLNTWRTVMSSDTRHGWDGRSTTQWSGGVITTSGDATLTAGLHFFMCVQSFLSLYGTISLSCALMVHTGSGCGFMHHWVAFIGTNRLRLDTQTTLKPDDGSKVSEAGRRYKRPDVSHFSPNCISRTWGGL